jgi:hypothetical protein
MTKTIYKDLEGTKSDSKPNKFTGYEIQEDYGRVSFVIEYLDGEVLGTITFRPTKTPVIFFVKYGNYREERYNHGGISCVYTEHYNCRLYGEYRKYSTIGSLIDVQYYNDGELVTNDIMKFVNFSGSTSDFKMYEFGEDEHFNICMQYGAYFKFINEYIYSPERSNQIVEYCLK